MIGRVLFCLKVMYLETDDFNMGRSKGVMQSGLKTHPTP